MKRVSSLFCFALVMVTLMSAELRSFKGTVVKMQMSECTSQHGLMSGVASVPMTGTASCPEYTVLNDKVVYVIVGRHAEQFIPLAEDINFLVRKNELVVFSDDEKSQSRFFVKEMTLRSDWEREESRRQVMAQIAERSASYELRNPPRTSLVQASSK